MSRFLFEKLFLISDLKFILSDVTSFLKKNLSGLQKKLYSGLRISWQYFNTLRIGYVAALSDCIDCGFLHDLSTHKRSIQVFEISFSRLIFIFLFEEFFTWNLMSEDEITTKIKFKFSKFFFLILDFWCQRMEKNKIQIF